VRNQRQFDARVSLLTAGRDRHYSLGLASALMAEGLKFDFVAGDDLESAELAVSCEANFLNLRGEQGDGAGLARKIWRVLAYYLWLLAYATTARPRVFHILWNNKFEWFDRTLLMGFYKMLGKKIALTAHNINIGRRDGHNHLLNRASLKFQYRFCDHIFVHTAKMKEELISEFGVREDRIVLIPFGINNAVPNTALTGGEARRRLGLGQNDKALLFFGNIAPYKGLEFLVEAFGEVLKQHPSARLMVTGRPKGPRSYWEEIEAAIAGKAWGNRVIKKIGYIPDQDVEIYFKAADALVLPYTCIFQSAVLFLAYSFGLPVIATDVGSFREEISEGKTGFICPAQSGAGVAGGIDRYFRSDLYRELASRRAEIRNFANEKCSWSKVAAITTAAYSRLLRERENKGTEQPQKNHEAIGLHSHSSVQR
jgi:D-inositol-3-phosphate glycosyltransferase